MMMTSKTTTMKFFVCCSLLAYHVYAVPLSMVMNSPGIMNPNALDDFSVVNDSNEDVYTAHPLGHLSSAATCLVAGVEYTHGQQIYRKDPCEFCLCLDGEMFCWWQDCPPAAEGPCKDRGPFTPCQIKGAMTKSMPPKMETEPKPTTKSSESVASTLLLSTQSSERIEEVPVSSTEMIQPDRRASVDDMRATTTINGNTPNPLDGTTDGIASVEAPKICTVMGHRYNIGDRLPHDTGNCVECICGIGAQISCSPHLCAPPGDDINDYRPPGLRSAQLDVF